MHILRLDHFRLVVDVVADQVQRAARQALYPFNSSLTAHQQQEHAFLFWITAFLYQPFTNLKKA